MSAYVVVTPARDEEKNIAQLIDAMERQTLRPLEWILVNDGSKDRTGELLDTFAAKLPWVQVIHRVDRGRRLAGAGVVRAFYDGFAMLEGKDWEFVVKLDADLSLDPRYFERCLQEFSHDPRLGIAGGTVCIQEGTNTTVEARGDPPFHVRGATKIYRRECWEAIGGIMAETGWDTADEVIANMLGWRTRTLADISLLQLRPTGKAYGGWRDSVKNGKGSYICGYHPLFIGAGCARRLIQGRRPVSAAGLAYGYLAAHILLRGRRVPTEMVRYLRREQINALLRRPSIYSGTPA